jgi:DNA-binding NtrC family response regulator
MANAILLVDDDRHILETAQDILEAAGYQVQTAETGAEALQKLQGGPFHLMLCDFHLNDTTGVDLALEVKRLHPEVVLILMTGEAEVDLGPAEGAVHSLLTKPVNPADLLRIIRTVFSA